MADIAKLRKRATEFEQKKQLDKALAEYTKVLNEMDDCVEQADAALYNRVGDLALRQGYVTQAVKHYERAADLYTEGGLFNNAIAMCNKILRNDSDHSAVYHKLGKISAKKGFVNDAKQHFLAYADRMQRANRLDEAFRAIGEFADLCPDQDDTRLMLAEQLIKYDRRDEAVEQLQILYEKYSQDGREREAHATAERMKSIDPTIRPRMSLATPAPKAGSLVFLDVSYDDAATLRRNPLRPTEDAGAARPMRGNGAPEVPRTSLPSASAGLPAGTRSSTGSPSLSRGHELERKRIDGPAEAGGSAGRDLKLIFPDETDSDRREQPLAPSAAASFASRAPDSSRRASKWDSEEDSVHPSGEMAFIHPEQSATLPTADDSLAMDELRDLVPIGDVTIPDLELEAVPERGIQERALAASVHSPVEADAALDDMAGVSEGMTDEGEREQAGEVGREGEVDGEGEEDARRETAGAFEIQLEQSAFLSAVNPVGAGRRQRPFDTARGRLAAASTTVRTRCELAIDRAIAGDHAMALDMLGHLLSSCESASDAVGATAVLDAIIEIDPDSVSHHQRRVKAVLRIGERTSLVNAYVELADALRRLGSADKARVIYSRVADLAPDHAHARAALAEIPETPQFATLAVVARTSGQLRAVAQPQPTAPALAPVPTPPGDTAPPTPPGRPREAIANPDDFINLADWLRDDAILGTSTDDGDSDDRGGGGKAHIAEALDQFKQEVARNMGEDDFEAHYDLGVAYKEMGMMDDAIAEFQKALRGTDRRVRTYEALGQCFVEKRQFAFALTILGRALNDLSYTDDMLVGVLYLLGLASESSGNRVDAAGYFRRVLAVDPDFRDARERITALERGG